MSAREDYPVCVYVFGKDGGPYKIGHSRRPRDRVQEFCLRSPGPMLGGPDARVIHEVQFLCAAHAQAVERGVHVILQARRIRSKDLRGVGREWFDVDIESVLRAIEDATAVLLKTPAEQTTKINRPTSAPTRRISVELKESTWAEIEELRREYAAIPPITEVLRELIAEGLAERRAARQKP